MENIRIPIRLNGDNYHDWKFEVKVVMCHRGCWDAVSGTTPKPQDKDELKEWEKHVKDGLTIIGLTVEPSQYIYIRDAENGYDAWKRLKEIYEKNTRATRINLKRQFYNFHHEPSAPMIDYVSGITDLAAKLKAIGVSLTDEDITDVLIFNLHFEYSSVAATLAASKTDLTVRDVTSALLEEEQRRGGVPTAGGTALMTKFGDGKGPASVRKSFTPGGRDGYDPRSLGCYRCGRTGHIWRFCTAKRTVNGEEIPDDWKSAINDQADKKDDESKKASVVYAVNESLNDEVCY